MYLNESPPRKKILGGSMKATIKDGLTRSKNFIKVPLKSTSSSTTPLIFSDELSTSITEPPTTITSTATSTSTTTTTSIIVSSQDNSNNFRDHHHHHHHHHSNHPYNNSRINFYANGSGNNNSSTKRTKKNAWGTRERSGKSFLIVIAFFAVFGLIILTELFMIDEENHEGIILSNRLGDSMPDYDNVKDDYDLVETNLLGDANRIYQFRKDNKLKIQDPLSVGIPMVLGALNGGSNSIDGGGNKNGNRDVDGIKKYGTGNYGAAIPWGQKLDIRIEITLPHYPIGMKPTDGIWQVVNGTRFKFFVYSAYYDRRDGKMIRVIGATKTRGPEKVWCRLWYLLRDQNSNNKTKYYSATVMGRVKIIRENWNLKYSACFVLCPLRTPGVKIPNSVSVVSRLRAPPGNVILIRNTDEDNDFVNSTLKGPISQYIPDKMAVCVKPFHFNYDQALYLMEYLELNTLLGVSHFTFYNHTLGPHATCVLQHYINGDIPGNLIAVDDYDFENFDIVANTSGNVENKSQQSYNNNLSNSSTTTFTNKKNINIKKTQHFETIYKKPTVNILQWDLRMRSQKEIRTEGLFAALNDCLYRNMYRYKYLALVDLDEFIMPRHNDTLGDLLGWLNRRYTNRNAGSYSFQNAFFYLQFPDDPLLYETSSMNPALRASLVTQKKTKRRSKLHPQKQRSKYICKPEAVVEAGNHFVWEFIPGKGSLNVPADAGILHHYRVCEFGGDDCIKSPSVVDRTATKYMKRLLSRVDSVYNYLKKPCNLDNLPPPPKRPPPTTKRISKSRNLDQLITTAKLKAQNQQNQQNKLKQSTGLNQGDEIMKIKVKLK